MSHFQVTRAVLALRQGGVIAYPTEAIYGLGCDPWNQSAVRRLLDIKQRPISKGLIIVAADIEQLHPFLAPLSDDHLAKVMATWPGPHTWVIPASARAPQWITGSHQGIAVRVSAHPVVAELCRQFAGPIVSTSANLSGRPPSISALQTRLRLGTWLDHVVSGETSGLLSPSRIKKIEDDSVLR